eukprot:1579338-Rhodomonas_salina.2
MAASAAKSKAGLVQTVRKRGDNAIDFTCDADPSSGGLRLFRRRGVPARTLSLSQYRALRTKLAG